MNECVPELNQEYAFDILLCLAQQMLPITELWRSYLENNKTNS